MNKYVKSYLLRGLIFGGFGPIVLGIVYLILQLSGVKVEINGYQICLAIVTTYVIAFVHAGSSVFPQIDKWSAFKSAFFQGISLYSVYTIGYLINSWIPLKPIVILIYSAIFIGAFVVIWIVVYLVSRKATKKMNEKLSELNK